MSILRTLKHTCMAVSFIVSSQTHASLIQDVQISTQGQGIQIEARGGKTNMKQTTSTISNTAEQASDWNYRRKLFILALLKFYKQPRIHN